MSDDIIRERMITEVARNVEEILGQYIGEMQSTQSADYSRQGAVKAVSAYMQSLAGNLGPSIGPNGDVEIAASIENNPPTSVERGYLTVSFVPHTERGKRFLDRLSEGMG